MDPERLQIENRIVVASELELIPNYLLENTNTLGKVNHGCISLLYSALERSTECYACNFNCILLLLNNIMHLDFPMSLYNNLMTTISILDYKLDSS